MNPLPFSGVFMAFMLWSTNKHNHTFTPTLQEKHSPLSYLVWLWRNGMLYSFCSQVSSAATAGKHTDLRERVRKSQCYWIASCILSLSLPECPISSWWTRGASQSAPRRRLSRIRGQRWWRGPALHAGSKLSQQWFPSSTRWPSSEQQGHGVRRVAVCH